MRSGFFDNTEVYADDFAVFARGALTSGLINDAPEDEEFTDFLVTPADGGMTVRIQPGFCWIDGRFGAAETAETVTLEAASSTADRYDRIVARLNYRRNSVYFTYIKGTDGGGIPDIVRETDPMANVTGAYDLGLAVIRIRAGTVAITQEMITDTRGVDGICEYVHYRNSEAAIVDGKASQADLNRQTDRITRLREVVDMLLVQKLYLFDFLTKSESADDTGGGEPRSLSVSNVKRGGEELKDYHAAEIAGTVRASVQGGTMQTCAFNIAVNADAGRRVEGSQDIVIKEVVDGNPRSAAFTVKAARGNNTVEIAIEDTPGGSGTAYIYGITLERVRGLALK